MNWFLNYFLLACLIWLLSFSLSDKLSQGLGESIWRAQILHVWGPEFDPSVRGHSFGGVRSFFLIFLHYLFCKHLFSICIFHIGSSLVPNQCESMLEVSLRENSDSLLFRGEVGVGIEGREKVKGTFTLLQISALTCQRNPLFIFHWKLLFWFSCWVSKSVKQRWEQKKSHCDGSFMLVTWVWMCVMDYTSQNRASGIVSKFLATYF